MDLSPLPTPAVSDDDVDEAIARIHGLVAELRRQVDTWAAVAEPCGPAPSGRASRLTPVRSRGRVTRPSVVCAAR